MSGFINGYNGSPDTGFYPACCIYPPQEIVGTALPNVLTIQAGPVVRIGDNLTPHFGFPVCPFTVCPPLPRIVVGNSSVIINGQFASTLPDIITNGTNFTIASCDSNVIVN